MGAEPQYLLVNVVAPPDQNFQTLEKIYAEFSNLWKKYGAEVVGGDLAQGPVLELHVFGVGRVPKGTALLRSGAQPGDHIYVTGPLGGAQQTGKQFTFEPRLEWGRALRESGVVTSMMDISDGLATDVAELDESGNRIIRIARVDEFVVEGQGFNDGFDIGRSASRSGDPPLATFGQCKSLFGLFADFVGINL